MIKCYVFLLLIGILAIPSCTSPSQLVIQSRKSSTPKATQSETKKLRPHPHFSSFWEALQNGYLPNSIEGKPLNSEQLQFIEALQSLLDRDFPKAEKQFLTLAHHCKDLKIRTHACELIAEIYFFQSKWNELAILVEHNQSLPENSSQTSFLNTLASFPPEEIHFPSTPTVMPITIGKAGIPEIEIEINGVKKVFWIDTGAKLSVISSKTAKECGIAPLSNQTINAGTSTTKNVKVLPTMIPELKIGDLRIKNHPALILDSEDLTFKWMKLYTLFEINGLIGWNALQKMHIELNYKNQKVTIQKPIKKSSPSLSENLFWMGYPIVRVSTPTGIFLNFGFDSGSNQSFIRENVFSKIEASDIQSTTKKIGGAGGWDHIDTKILSKFSILLEPYLLNFSNISTGISDPSTFIKLDGTLGSDIARHGSLTIDMVNGQFQLKFPQQK